MTAEQKALELVERFCNISKEITFTEATLSIPTLLVIHISSPVSNQIITCNKGQN